jgi:hypothetical protein
LEEPSVEAFSKYVQYGDINFGSKTFTLGKHSIVNARCLFSFTSQKFTFRDEVWEEVLETPYPGRQLMTEPVFIAKGVDKKIASPIKRFDSLQRLHNLFISDYIRSLQIVGFQQASLRSRGKRHPLLFTFNDLYGTTDCPKKMKKPLLDAFGSVCYCVNPDPETHIPDMIAKYKTLSKCRMMCDTIGWIHTLLYLLDQRICAVFRLDAEIRNWLAKKKPKKANAKNKSKVRLAVEDLLKKIKKERAQLNEMINLLPRAKQFEDLYLEEDEQTRAEMLLMAKSSTNASKRLSGKGAKKLEMPGRESRTNTPEPPNPIADPPPDPNRMPRASKLDRALLQKRIQSTTKKKKKGFSLGATVKKV